MWPGIPNLIMVVGQFLPHLVAGKDYVALVLTWTSVKSMQHCQINLSHFAWKIQEIDNMLIKHFQLKCVERHSHFAAKTKDSPLVEVRNMGYL